MCIVQSQGRMTLVRIRFPLTCLSITCPSLDLGGMEKCAGGPTEREQAIPTLLWLHLYHSESTCNYTWAGRKWVCRFFAYHHRKTYLPDDSTGVTPLFEFTIFAWQRSCPGSVDKITSWLSTLSLFFFFFFPFLILFIFYLLYPLFFQSLLITCKYVDYVCVSIKTKKKQKKNFEVSSSYLLSVAVVQHTFSSLPSPSERI